MKREPSSNGPVIAAIMLALLVLLGGYVGGYFWLSDMGLVILPDNPSMFRFRYYRYQWVAMAFWPLAKLESAVTGEEVVLRGIDGPLEHYQ